MISFNFFSFLGSYWAATGGGRKVECKVNKFCYLKSRVFSVWFNFFSFLGSYWAATGGKGWMQGK